MRLSSIRAVVAVVLECWLILVLAGGCVKAPRHSHAERAAVSATAPANGPGRSAKAEARLNDFTTSVGMRLVWIPAGSFSMGSPATEKWHQREEGPLHDVRISSPFWIGAYEVTQEQYQAIMGTNPSAHRGNPRLPVANVDWNEAVDFCRELSKKEGRHYRLPTEAEWEYACRAGTSTPWFFGDAPDRLHEYVVCGGDAAVDRPAAIGTHKPNPWGLYDVLGNVREWVLDKVEFDHSDLRGGFSSHEFDLRPYADGQEVDPAGEKRGAGRIARGGSYRDGAGEKQRPELESCARFCRCAARWGRYPFWGVEDIGFRVVCEQGSGSR